MKTKIAFLTMVSVIVYYTAPAKYLKATLAYKTFYTGENGPYIETYLSVAGRTVDFVKKANGTFQAAIEVGITIKMNDEIKHIDKYNLLSPEVADTSNMNFNFLDQQRIQLSNGKYVLELSITDKNSPAGKTYKSQQEVMVEFYPNIIGISDLELVDSYKKADANSSVMLTKSGFEIIPYADNYFADGIQSLKFYAEIYNTDRILGTDPFLLSYYIETYENKRMIENFHGFAKRDSKKTDVLLSEFPIIDLPSGNYNLVVEVRNKANELVAFKECFFQRNNSLLSQKNQRDLSKLDVSNSFVSKYTTKDTLAFLISSLRPISDNLENQFESNQLKIADATSMQQFLFDFWQRRNPENPEQAWMQYFEKVRQVNAEYKTLNKKGFETDRGRVYLQYGPPNTIQKQYHEPSAYPYEIWHYYKLANQSNRKFVFYDADLI